MRASPLTECGPCGHLYLDVGLHDVVVAAMAVVLVGVDDDGRTFGPDVEPDVAQLVGFGAAHRGHDHLVAV